MRAFQQQMARSRRRDSYRPNELLMSKPSNPLHLPEIAEALDRDATELEKARDTFTLVKPHHLFRRTSRTVIHACRLLFDAKAAGANVLSLLAPGLPGFEMNPNDDRQVLSYWRLFAFPYLLAVNRNAFAGWSGQADFSRFLTDEEGCIVGKDRKPLGMDCFGADGKRLHLGIIKKDGTLQHHCEAKEAISIPLHELASSVRVLEENGKPLRPLGRGDVWRLIGEPATEADVYDERDNLNRLQEQAKDWADACRAAAGLIRGELLSRQPQPPSRGSVSDVARYSLGARAGTSSDSEQAIADRILASSTASVSKCSGTGASSRIRMRKHCAIFSSRP